MAIISKGLIVVKDGQADTEELLDCVGKMENCPDGEFGFLLFDKEQNRLLPKLKHLFGVVFQTISEEHPDHPPVNALYNFFEDRFCPRLSCMIDGRMFEFLDMKTLPSVDFDSVVEDIISYAQREWHIDILDRIEAKNNGSCAATPYHNAYATQWTDYSRKI